MKNRLLMIFSRLCVHSFSFSHRINTSVFKPVDFLSNKFVLQVVCGQQHTLCRAVDRSVMDTSVIVGSGTGADVYVWGNGMLGQLGLGIKGTSKGRLLPTLIPFFQDQFPMGAICVGAGANFSSVVVKNGEVYSFGHAEYNQHGTGNTSNRDYVDPHYFFVPRAVPIYRATSHSSAGGHVAPEKVAIRSVSCGSMFSIGITEQGDVYSWGWNEGSALGHATNYFSAAPQKVDKVTQVAQVACGAKHVLTLREEPGTTWLQFYQTILKELPHADMVITIDEHSSSVFSVLGRAHASANSSSSTNSRSETSFRCHRAVIAARCRYLRGVLDTSSHFHALENPSSDHSVSIHLSGPHYNAVTIRALLDYFYLNRVHVPAHKRREMVQVAQDLMLTTLEEAVIAEILREEHTHRANLTEVFLRDILQLYGSERYADVVFVVPHEDDYLGLLSTSSTVSSTSHSSSGKSSSSSASAAAEWKDCGLPSSLEPSAFKHMLFAHKALVQRVPYLEALLSSNFRDSSLSLPMTTQDSLGRTVTQIVQVIDLTSLLEDGMDFSIFAKVILYAYTGQLSHEAPRIVDGKIQRSSDSEYDPALELGEIMQLLVASNRLGFNPLAQYCERRISLSIAFSTPDDVYQCYRFAQYFNLPRLEMQCLAFLRHVAYDLASADEGSLAAAEVHGDDNGSEPHCP